MKTKATEWYNREFNEVQLEVLIKMSGDELLEYIRQPSNEERAEEWLDHQFKDERKEIQELYETYVEEGSDDSLSEWLAENYDDEISDWLDEQEPEYPMWNTCFEFRNDPPARRRRFSPLPRGFPGRRYLAARGHYHHPLACRYRNVRPQRSC